MKFDSLAKKLYQEVYLPKTSSVMKDGDKPLSTKKGAAIPKEKTGEADKVLEAKVKQFMDNPSDARLANEILNIVDGITEAGILNKTYSKNELLKAILNIAATSGNDYKKILSRENGGSGEEWTVDDWQQNGFSYDYYNVVREILKQFNVYPVERSRKEVASGKQEIFFFGESQDGDTKPYRTTVFVPADGRIGKAFWNPGYISNAYGEVIPPPMYQVDGIEMKPVYKPKELIGKDLNFIRDAVNHEEAKKAHLQMYPREQFPKMYRY